MGASPDNEKDDMIELLRESQPTDLDRLQRDLERDQQGHSDDQHPGGSNQQ